MCVCVCATSWHSLHGHTTVSKENQAGYTQVQRKWTQSPNPDRSDQAQSMESMMTCIWPPSHASQIDMLLYVLCSTLAML
ncbi:hypothetical protein BDQ94DRAFT_103956 [Aspergillus welwitschiae]|uniref:Uncharacterized protein n=1 Tax=Aspergillus welwitschiae TaxID=1341132 RepID=A0A3F3QCM0_9EURO|nr:hypothetical protein BDQ94DRAFT_103956 [Aspergillus welwitschiae]RDH36941.1 hypothetical protein BDQ94DRAFT_103956 [Aspergillus welwitschiae]